MKSKVTYLLISALMAAACTDKSYQGIESEMAADEALPIHIVVGDPGDILESKGSGPVEDTDGAMWEGKTIHVFAFKRDLNSDYANISATGHDDCIIDGSVDTEGALGGKEATVNTDDSYITWKNDDQTLYYRPGNQPYDFFAYYTDKPVPDSDVYRSKEGVRIMMDVDGSTDIMSAYAYLTEEQLNRPVFSDMDKVDLNTYAFSSWSAKRNIHPVLYFDHHLTRFDFEVKAGWEKSNDIIIDSLVVRSRRRAVFTVAHKNPSLLGLDFSNAPYEMTALSEADGSPLRKDFWKLHYIPGSEEMTKLGGSLMIAPDITYDAFLYLKQKMEDGEVKTHENLISLVSSEGQFTAGSQYLVSATIYGLTSIDISVKTTDWQEGGSIDVGNDKFEE